MQQKHHDFYIANKDAISIKNKEYKEFHSEWKKEYDRQYHINHLEHARILNRQWREQNKDYINEKRRLWALDRRHTNPQYKLALVLRRRIFKVLKHGKKLDHFNVLLGCSLEEARLHIEKQFKEGMTWDNWGAPKVDKICWVLDHIRPLASFDLSDLEQQRRAFHYTNLLPIS